MERLVKSAGRQNRFMPEPCAVEVHGIEEARDMYRAIGRFCAIAIKTEHLVDFSFADFFWRRVMQEEVSLEQNLADLDREGEEDFARSMRTILNTPLKELEMTDGEFDLTRNLSSSGEVGIRDQTVELVLGGANIELTDENKEEYVTALLDHKLGASISLAAEGFRTRHHLVPPPLGLLMPPVLRRARLARRSRPVHPAVILGRGVSDAARGRARRERQSAGAVEDPHALQRPVQCGPRRDPLVLGGPGGGDAR